MTNMLRIVTKSLERANISNAVHLWTRLWTF